MITYIGKTMLIEEGKEKIVVVGDLHLGYEESLHKSGVSVGNRLFEEMKREFGEIFEETGKVGRIVLLGDVKHQFSENSQQEWKDVGELVDIFGKNCEKISIIKGNHDNYLMNIVGKRKSVEVVDRLIVGENAFVHGDRDFEEIWSGEIKRVIMGHVHPAITMDDGVKKEKYKCFLVGKYRKKEFIVVPSFFEGFIGSDVRDGVVEMGWEIDFGKFEVLVVCGLDVLNFGILKNI